MSFADEVRYKVSQATLWQCRRCGALVEIPTPTPLVTLQEALSPNARLRIHECDQRTGAHGVLEVIGTPALKEPEQPEGRMVGKARGSP
jgi:hypothetical protein